jgi:hypothetical protein
MSVSNDDDSEQARPWTDQLYFWRGSLGWTSTIPDAVSTEAEPQKTFGWLWSGSWLGKFDATAWPAADDYRGADVCDNKFLQWASAAIHQKKETKKKRGWKKRKRDDAEADADVAATPGDDELVLSDLQRLLTTGEPFGSVDVDAQRSHYFMDNDGSGVHAEVRDARVRLRFVAPATASENAPLRVFGTAKTAFGDAEMWGTYEPATKTLTLARRYVANCGHAKSLDKLMKGTPPPCICALDAVGGK